MGCGLGPGVALLDVVTTYLEARGPHLELQSSVADGEAGQPQG